MTILGIGVDVVYTPRIAALIARRGSRRLATRILSPKEFTHWESRPQPDSDASSHTRFFAVRWALKEAAYKAMYPIVRPTWKELTYCGLGAGQVDHKPSLIYRPHVLANLSNIGAIQTSVSHDGDYVFVSVLIERPTCDG